MGSRESYSGFRARSSVIKYLVSDNRYTQTLISHAMPINPSKIPDSALVDIPQLLSWAATCAEEMYKNVPMVRESPDVLSRLISTGVFTDLDNIGRHSVRFNLALEPNVNGVAKPIWESIKPLTTPVAIPPYLLKP